MGTKVCLAAGREPRTSGGGKRPGTADWRERELTRSKKDLQEYRGKKKSTKKFFIKGLSMTAHSKNYKEYSTRVAKRKNWKILLMDCMIVEKFAKGTITHENWPRGLGEISSLRGKSAK